MRRFAREQGTTYFSILLAGFVAFLGRSARSDDVAVSTGFHGRFHPGTKDTIGDFSNNIVVRGRLTEQSTFRKLSRDIGHQIQEGIRHDHLHQSHFASIANFEQSTAKVPFLPVKFSEGPENAESIDLDGLQVNSRPRTADTTYLLTDVIVRSFGNQTRLEIATPVRLYSEAWVKRMIDGYLQFLRGAVSAPDDPIRQMPNWRIAAQGRRRTKRRLTRSIPG